MAVAAGCGGGEGDDGPPLAPVRGEDRSLLFGISAGGNIEFASEEDLVRELDGYASLGAHWFRLDLKWSVIEPASGDYRWERYDRVVEAARERGFAVLGTITYTPEWQRPPGTDDKHAPADPEAYARFAAETVRHFAPRGVTHYELWNEPNLPSFWGPAPDAEAYTRLVKAAYPAMKEVDPSIIVLAGGLAPVGGTRGPDCRDGDERVNPIPFLEAMYAAGAAGSFDALSYHPYTGGQPPGDEHPCNGWHQMDGTDPSLRSVMEAAGDGDKQIWATEYGADAVVLGEDVQAHHVRTALELWPPAPWAGPLTVYAYRDPGNDGFNLVREDWSPRPAWDAFREAAAGR